MSKTPNFLLLNCPKNGSRSKKLLSYSEGVLQKGDFDKLFKNHLLNEFVTNVMNYKTKF